MNQRSLNNALRLHRQASGLSQQALADLVGSSRQGIIAIEAGRQIPSTVLSLRLARALQCNIEQLFHLAEPHQIQAHLVPTEDPLTTPKMGMRVHLGWIQNTWVAHPLAPKDMRSADGVIVAISGLETVFVEPFHPVTQLQNAVLVAGCAPILSALARRFPRVHSTGHITWLSTSSQHALDLLQQGWVHIAGIHLLDSEFQQANQKIVEQRFANHRMQMVHLTRWRQGWVLPPGNPKGFLGKESLLEPGLRIAQRPNGAGAQKLMRAQLESLGASNHHLIGPMASGHADVARLIEVGAADVGLAIESEALSAGLDFIPLTKERFDLVTSVEVAQIEAPKRVLESVGNRQFRKELEYIPGYDSELTGQAQSVEGLSFS